MSQPFLCPVDQTALVMSERQGIEIDYCPTCRGVWLDRGELDKIIERNAATAPAQQPVQQPAQRPVREQAPQQRQDASHWGDPRHSGDHGYGGKPHKRRKSFLEDLFD